MEMLLVANWKANKTLEQAFTWLDYISGINLPEGLTIIIAAPYPLIAPLKGEIMANQLNIKLASQDISKFENGAYTGEVTCEAVLDLVKYCLVGHSERRTNFGETDQDVAQKSSLLIKNNIVPIVCVQDQTTPVPQGVRWVAYEPPSAIGSGEADETSHIGQVVSQINAATQTKVLYGGSVDEGNIKSIADGSGVSGFLVGGASLNPEEFASLVSRL